MSPVKRESLKGVATDEHARARLLGDDEVEKLTATDEEPEEETEEDTA